LNERIKRKGKPKIKERFGFAVRKRRHELGISQEGLAERAGLHRTYVADIERGIRNVSIENVEKLAIGLEISISTLFAEYGVDG
jgi:transcriptional regulator with XRE-family HTH domain